MRQKQGLTVLEILVVVCIIAILLGLISVHVFRTVEKAKLARVMEDTAQLKAAAINYYSDIGLWPPDVCPDEDPGFLTIDAYKTRCCGQDYDVLQNLSLNLTGDDYDTTIENYWDGPYLEKFPSPTPWGGSYDWEFWPHEPSWAQPSGVYVSVREKYFTKQRGGTSCGSTGATETTVPDNYEVKMQQIGLDVHCSNSFPDSCNAANVNVADNLVIINIMHFNFSE